MPTARYAGQAEPTGRGWSQHGGKVEGCAANYFFDKITFVTIRSCHATDRKTNHGTHGAHLSGSHPAASDFRGPAADSGGRRCGNSLHGADFGTARGALEGLPPAPLRRSPLTRSSRIAALALACVGTLLPVDAARA